MTIPAKIYRNQYYAAAGQTEFDFDFRIFQRDDVNVYLLPVGSLSNPPGNLLVIDTDYSIDFYADQAGGKITLVTPATLNDVLTIEGNISNSRSTDFTEGGKIDAATLDRQLDKLTALIAQATSIAETLVPTYNVDETLGPGQLDLPKLGANQIWKANDEGNLTAAECIDEKGCSTLRDELKSQTMGAPGTDNIGIYDIQESKGMTLTEFTESEIRPQFDDISVAKNRIDPTKQVQFDLSNIGNLQIRKLIMPDNDVNLGSISSVGIPRGYIDGFEMERKESAPKVLVVYDGAAMSRDNSVPLQKDTAMYGNVSLLWSPGNGDNVGKLAAGTFAPNARPTYHVGLLGKTGSSDVDFGIDADYTFAPLLANANVIAAGYTKVRYIGTIQCGLDANISRFIQRGDYFWWYSPYNIATPEYKQTGLNQGQTYSVPLRVPYATGGGLRVLPFIGLALESEAVRDSLYFFSADLENTAYPSTVVSQISTSFISIIAPNYFYASNSLTGIYTADNGTIYYKPFQTSADAVVNIMTKGYLSSRGKNLRLATV